MHRADGYRTHHAKIPTSPPMGHLTRFGDLLPTITRAQRTLITAASTIYQDAPDADDLAFMARELVQCTMPHSDPGPVPFWRRRNGNVTLSIQSGYDPESDGLVGYPYGSIPRLIMFWLTTEALRRKSPMLELGPNYTAYIRQIGLDPATGGGKRGDGARVRMQTRRLFASSISFIEMLKETGETIRRNGERRMNMPVTSSSELWWNPRKPDQTALWDSWVELGDKFFQAITAAPVPVDIRALKALKQSPLALDLYAWATHKALSVSRKGKSQFVPWRGLMQQFGGDYADVQNFRRKAEKALVKIQQVYPGLQLRQDKGSGGVIVLSSSTPAVPVRAIV